jgi:hypothetical protein
MDAGASFAAQIRCLMGDQAARKACRAACTVETCPLILSYWSYRPSVPVNATFAAISGIFVLIVLVLGIWTKRFKMYTAVMVIGSGMEVIGYVARIYAYTYPFSDVSSHTLLNPFVMLMSCTALFHYSTDLPDVGTGLLRSRHLLFPLQNCAGFWRTKFSHPTCTNS